jgi:hypothetical protein
LYAKADESAAAVYANELLTDVHGHILVVSACWSELSHFESQDGAVTRIFLNPAPEEESNYVHSMGTYLFREWEDVSKQLKEFLKL